MKRLRIQRAILSPTGFFVLFIIAGFVLGLTGVQNLGGLGGSKLADYTYCSESGTLSTNTTWTTACVYEIEGLEIPSGKTLTIDPGVVVKVDSGNIQVDSGGTLDVPGTSDNPVIFTSMNDNSVGGDTGSGSPAVADYDSAVEMDGGTLDASYANFEYAGTPIIDTSNDSDSESVTVTHSSFSNDYRGISLTNAAGVSLSVQSSTLDVGGADNNAIAVTNDGDLTGIVLAGSDKNTFTGSATTVYVETSTIPSDETWEVASDSGAIISSAGNGYGVAGITDNGTLDLDSGAELLAPSGDGASVAVNGTANLADGSIVKSGGTPFEVYSGGTLDATGTSDSPVIFTSINDNSVGGDTGSGSPAVDDYVSAVTMDGGTASMQYINVQYADIPVETGGDGISDPATDVRVTDSSFTNDSIGVNLQALGAVSLTLERNTFDVSAESYSQAVVTVSDDTDLTGIVLSGDNANTFTGTGIAVYADNNSDVPSDETWEIPSDLVIQSSANDDGVVGMTVDGTMDMDSGAELLAPGDEGYTSVAVNGVMDIASGSIVKGDSGSAIEVNSGGTLDATGTSEDPVVFTSLNDNSVGGSTGSGSPAIDDYDSAVDANGGTISLDYVDFGYAANDVGYPLDGDTTGSNVTVEDSHFTNSYTGVEQYGDNTLVLEKNSFDLGSSNFAINTSDDADLTGIVLTGEEENTFTGSGADVVVEVNGTVPSGEPWDLDNSSGAALLLNGVSGGYGVTIYGTVDISPGVVIKVVNDTNGFDVESDGVLDADASDDSSTPIVFSSEEDSSVGDAINNDDSSTGTPGDYTTAIRFEEPSDSNTIKYIDFKYAASAISIGATGTLDVTDDQFADNQAAFEPDTTSTTNPELGLLDCVWPYANSINISGSWFGSGGLPGDSADLSAYLGSIDGAESDAYPILGTLEVEVNSMYDLVGSISDNTIPWTIWTCGLGDDESVTLPVTDVNVNDFSSPAIADSALWPAANLEE